MIGEASMNKQYRATKAVLQLSYKDRFLAYTKPVGRCWLWQRALDRYGYGRFCIEGKEMKAHRAAYYLFVGPFDPSLSVDHLCRNPQCVNPAHLEPVPIEENNRRKPRPIVCKAGHRYDRDNSYWIGTKRNCRACNRAAVAKYAAKKAVSAA